MNELNSLFFHSYLNTYWKKPLFDLLEKLRATLDRIYGEGKVTLIDASLRWMYHHSKMDGTYGGMQNCRVFMFFTPLWNMCRIIITSWDEKQAFLAISLLKKTFDVFLLSC